MTLIKTIWIINQLSVNSHIWILCPPMVFSIQSLLVQGKLTLHIWDWQYRWSLEYVMLQNDHNGQGVQFYSLEYLPNPNLNINFTFLPENIEAFKNYLKGEYWEVSHLWINYLEGEFSFFISRLQYLLYCCFTIFHKVIQKQYSILKPTIRP